MALGVGADPDGQLDQRLAAPRALVGVREGPALAAVEEVGDLGARDAAPPGDAGVGIGLDVAAEAGSLSCCSHRSTTGWVIGGQSVSCDEPGEQIVALVTGPGHRSGVGVSMLEERHPPGIGVPDGRA